jgi:hypothetical protein
MKNTEHTFSQKELLSIVATVGLTADRYNNWERPDRGIMPVVPTGRGNRRKYSLDDVAYLALVTVLADKVPHLAVATKLAAQIKSSIVNVLTSGTWDNAPVLILFSAAPTRGEWAIGTLNQSTSTDLRKFFRTQVHPRYAPSVLLDCGSLALELSGGLDDVFARREGFESHAEMSLALRLKGDKQE